MSKDPHGDARDLLYKAVDIINERYKKAEPEEKAWLSLARDNIVSSTSWLLNAEEAERTN